VLDAHNPEIVENLRGVGGNLCANRRALIQRIGSSAAADGFHDSLEASFAVHVNDTVCVGTEDKRRVDIRPLFRCFIDGARVFAVNDRSTSIALATVVLRVTVFAAASLEETVYSVKPILIFAPATRYSAAASGMSARVTTALPAVCAATAVSTLWAKTFASVLSTKTTPKSLPISPE
jgi:hypothetical protein